MRGLVARVVHMTSCRTPPTLRTALGCSSLCSTRLPPASCGFTWPPAPALLLAAVASLACRAATLEWSRWSLALASLTWAPASLATGSRACRAGVSCRERRETGLVNLDIPPAVLGPADVLPGQVRGHLPHLQTDQVQTEFCAQFYWAQRIM